MPTSPNAVTFGGLRWTGHHNATGDAREAILILAMSLRRVGVAVPAGQVLAAVDAATTFTTRSAKPLDSRDLYWSCRTSMISQPGDLSTFDKVFQDLFAPHAEPILHGLTVEHEIGVLDETEAPPTPPAPDEDDDSDDGDGPGSVGAVASAVELLRHRRFDHVTEDELRQMRVLMARIPLSLPRRRTLRQERALHGQRLDLGTTLRRSVRSDGELLDPAWRRRQRRPRPLVLVLDISGSMAGYSRALLQFAHAAARQADIEVFCFGTRLTRITTDLASRDVDEALASASDAVVDFDGGTLIGESFATLNRIHGRRGRLRGAVVIVCSDGLERGDPAVLQREAARLGRYAHRFVWVNPLAGDDRFQPVQIGMRAALPSVDRLVAGHDLASLESLSALVATLR